jgi:hypothetical protein
MVRIQKLVSAFLVGTVSSALLLTLIGLLMFALRVFSPISIEPKIGSFVIFQFIENDEIIGLSVGTGFPIICICLGVANAVFSEYIRTQKNKKSSL